MYRGSVFGLTPTGSQTASITPTSSGLQIAPDTGQFPFVLPYSGMDVDLGGYDGKQVVFSAPYQGGKLTIYLSDRAILKQVEASGVPLDFRPKLERVLSAGTRKLKRGLIWTIVIVAVIGGAGFGLWIGYGRLADWIVDKIPPSVESDIGKSGAASILQKTQVCSHPLLQKFVNEVGTRLVTASGDKRYKFHFKVTSTKAVNAFALPGGYVFVNLGLIEKAETPDEVAGVLAHEVQHALQRHGMRNLVRKAGLYILIALFFDASSAVTLLATGAAELTSLAFSRSQETDADVRGLDLMYKAGFNPEGLPKFFDRLRELEKTRGSVPTFVSTHPASDNRAKTLRKMIADRGKVKLVALKTNWKEVKTAPCTPIHFVNPDKDVDDQGPSGPGGPGSVPPPLKGPGDTNQPGTNQPPSPPQPGGPNQPPAPNDPNSGQGSGGS